MPRLKDAKLLFLLLFTPVLVGGCGDDDRTTSPQMLPNTWVFGGAGADWGGSLDTTSDGGQIIVGKTCSFGAGLDDVYLIRTDASGSVVWDTTFGSTGVERGASVVSAPDGGFVIVGETSSFGVGNGDVYLIKVDTSGGLVWQKTFGGPDADWGESVALTPDGGYIIAGGTFSYGAENGDVLLIKADDSGNLVWEKTFGGAEPDRGESVITSSDGGYVVAGRTSSFGAGGSDVYLIKTDVSGNLVWDSTFGGTGPARGKSVLENPDGSYAIVGQITTSEGDTTNVYLIKSDADGNLVWQATFGGAKADYGYSLIPTADGGYIIAGETHSFGAGNGDAYLIKADSSGNLVWQKSYGAGGSDWGRAVVPTSDGGYAITGGTMSFGAGSADVYLIRTDANGDL